jgi:hypothetical protein
MSCECSICERDLRGGHDPSCPHYELLICIDCGHLREDHDEEGECQICDCIYFRGKKDE